MKPKTAPSEQLRLLLPVHSPIAMSAEVERQVVSALADLLVAVAKHGDSKAQGENDE